jgi:Na+-transporting NADH:ubiquinone oxidoreductase subunit F
MSKKAISEFKATVTGVRNLSVLIKEIKLEFDPSQTPFTYEPGHFVMVKVPPCDISFTEFDITGKYEKLWLERDLRRHSVSIEKPIQKAYSLASYPGEGNQLLLIIKIALPPAGEGDVPPGKVSSYLFNLKEGDAITLKGPMGHFLAKESDNEMCFVGRGAGMAPLRSHILHQIKTLKTKRKITFWFCERSEEDLFYLEEFEELRKLKSDFSNCLSITQKSNSDKFCGCVGRIQNCMKSKYLANHPNIQNIEFYMCGPPQMMKETCSMLFDLGVKREMIFSDIY